MANRIQPYQIFYNFSINQINNILEKEIGKFFLGDINLVPSEYKDLGEDVADIWANLLDVAKSVGALTLDTSSQNTEMVVSLSTSLLSMICPRQSNLKQEWNLLNGRG